MPRAETWTLAQRMAAEKESFGFYFSAHPVDNYRHLADAHGARTFAELAALPAPADGGRVRRDHGGAGRGHALAHLGPGPPLHDGDPVRSVRPVRGDASSTTRSRSRSRPPPRPGSLRPAQRRARPAPRRGDAAGHDPLAPVFDSLPKRTRLQIEVEVEDERARPARRRGARAHGGTASSGSRRSSRSARPSSSSAATSSSTPSSPPGSSGSTASRRPLAVADAPAGARLIDRHPELVSGPGRTWC